MPSREHDRDAEHDLDALAALDGLAAPLGTPSRPSWRGRLHLMALVHHRWPPRSSRRFSYDEVWHACTIVAAAMHMTAIARLAT